MMNRVPDGAFYRSNTVQDAKIRCSSNGFSGLDRLGCLG